VLIRSTTIIIWDEFCVNNRHAFETLQRSLEKDILLKGQKLLIVCAGDFRQIPPIVRYGSKLDVLKACILYSVHWPSFTIIKLTSSQRDRNDPIHATAVLKIGEGRTFEGQVKEDQDTTIIPLPHLQKCNTLQELVDFVYPDIKGQKDCYPYMQNAILAGHNATIDDINTKIMDELDGEYHTFLSFDCIKDQDEDESAKMHLSEYVLNCLNEVGIPPHKIKLKVGGIAMLMRNISFKDRLCNSTKVIIDHVYASKNWIRVRIPQGPGKDAKLEDIFRITFDFEVLKNTTIIFNELCNMFFLIS
jgi:ATP-dependent DNA helicase PIF1